MYEEIAAWIRSKGLAVSGPPEEFYLSEPGTPPEETLTEIHFPVASLAPSRRGQRRQQTKGAGGGRLVGARPRSFSPSRCEARSGSRALSLATSSAR
ncbi:MAG: GyrI-like domain-containing protein [Deltaproteobacteria bacterium]|nr:GyrI-like domain-containing protein [Deltaproteobacteria bacterium]